MTTILIVAAALLVLSVVVIVRKNQQLNELRSTLTDLFIRANERSTEAQVRMNHFRQDVKPIVDFHLGKYRAGSGLLVAVEKLQRFVKEGLPQHEPTKVQADGQKPQGKKPSP